MKDWGLTSVFLMKPTVQLSAESEDKGSVRSLRQGEG